MTQPIFDYLHTQRIGVVAVAMLDGSPHAATVHFAYMQEPLQLLMMTNRNYKKCEPIIANGEARASFVVGFSETEMRTLQMDGTLAFADEAAVSASYFDRFPEKRERYNAPDDVFLMFTPTWWRFTDFKAPKEERIITSD